jgi:plastocyanin
LAVLISACSSQDDGELFVEEGSSIEADYRYTIPVGAGEALDAGEPLEILPAELEVEVGEVIEIVNEDERGHLVGPFFVGKGETLRQRFSSPGQFIGQCTVHPSGELTLTVVEG